MDHATLQTVVTRNSPLAAASLRRHLVASCADSSIGSQTEEFHEETIGEVGEEHLADDIDNRRLEHDWHVRGVESLTGTSHVVHGSGCS